jgi:type I restriction-modification system DNA methylase subunit
MAKRKNNLSTANATGATVGYEAQLWQMADAIAAIERDNPALKGVLPKDYARPELDKTRLGQLIDLISNIKVGDEESRYSTLLDQCEGSTLEADHA